MKIAKADLFDGLSGVFADSLPDGWNRLPAGRMLRKAGEHPEQIAERGQETIFTKLKFF